MASEKTTLSGRHYQSGQAIELEFADGKIVGTRPLAGQPIEALPWIAPGFLDIQSNGYGGQEFSSPELTAEQVAEIAAQQAAFGVTQFCPTVTTAGGETILHAMRTLADAVRRWPEVGHTIVGIHLEGPYIAREDGPRGAHPLEHCREPDWEEFCRFQSAAEGRIRIVTLSPEYAGSPSFIARTVASGVVVAIGHMSANSAQIRAAVDAGATLSTHLGNGAHRMLRRHPNYLWDQMADDRLMASLIVDGHHLPAEVVQSMVRAKTPERCILVSDLSGLAGLPPGRYATQLCDLEILTDGRLVIAGQDQLLAGASLPISIGVANVMQFAGINLPSAIHMATRQPARLLGIAESHLQPGDAADLVAFDLASGSGGVRALRVRRTISAGRVAFQA